MKRVLFTITIFLLALSLLAGCKAYTATPGTNSTTTTTTTAPQTSTSEIVYEEEASTHYINAVYPQQIRRYHTALSEKWDADTYFENGMSPLAAQYYEGNPLDNVGFSFIDLDADGIWELVISAILNAEKDPLVFEIWALQNGKPVMIAQSGSHNRYYLQYTQEKDLWSVAYEAENGAANRAVYDLQLSNGEFKVVRGVVFDALANEEAPWFMTYDLDWDTSNDTPIDEQTATSFMDASRNLYQAAECFPYNLYK